MRCAVTGTAYVGCSRRIKSRRIQHFSDLRHNRHHNKRLQQDFNEYGENSFVFIIERAASDSAHARRAEIELINKRKENLSAYNFNR